MVNLRERAHRKCQALTWREKMNRKRTYNFEKKVENGKRLFYEANKSTVLSDSGKLEVFTLLAEGLPNFGLDPCRNFLLNTYAHPQPAVDPWLVNTLAFHFLERTYDQEVGKHFAESMRKHVGDGSGWMLRFLTLACTRGYRLPLIQSEVMFNSLEKLADRSTFLVDEDQIELATLSNFCWVAGERKKAKLAKAVFSQSLVSYIRSSITFDKRSYLWTVVQTAYPFIEARESKVLCDIIEKFPIRFPTDHILEGIYLPQGEKSTRPVLLAGLEKEIFQRDVVGDDIAKCARLQDIVLTAVGATEKKQEEFFVGAAVRKAREYSYLVRPEQVMQSVAIVKNAAKKMDPQSVTEISSSLIAIVERKGTAFTLDSLVKLRDDIYELGGKAMAGGLELRVADYIANMKTIYLAEILRDFTKDPH